MISKKIYGYLLILTLLVITCPLISHGQSAITGNNLEMTMTPENPQPLQNVKINLQSFSYDLDRSKITWSVNGAVKRTEIGLKVFNLEAGKNGQKTIIKVSVVTPDNEVKEMEVFFIPSVVDIIYEAISYTPPFYKGKALNPSQGMVRVTAVPELIKADGAKVPAQNIVYSWKKDGMVEQSASGVGKNSFTFTGTIPVRDSIIEVNASSLDGNIYASNQVKITNISPEIIFYENSLVYGVMMNKAIKDTVNMQTDEFSVVAVPYFFSTGYATSPDLTYNWSMNGQNTDNQDPKNSFSSKIDKVSSGVANIALKIINAGRFLQSANSDYNINFSK